MRKNDLRVLWIMFVRNRNLHFKLLTCGNQDVLFILGGLNSTAEGMARFVSILFQEEPAGGEQIMSAESLRLMRTPRSLRHQGRYTSYGVGWAVVQIGGYDAIEHNGAILGHRAHVSAIPDIKLGIIVLSNSRNWI